VPTGAPRRFGSVVAHAGTWSPDGSKILYATGRDLYSAHSDGSEPQKILSAADFIDWPRWSPDGETIRFSVITSSNTGSLWEARADGTGLHRVLPGWNNPPAECCGNWTPDGRYFLFNATHDGRSDVWAIREKRGFLQKDSSAPVQLTSGPMNIRVSVPIIDGKKLFVTGAQ